MPLKHVGKRARDFADGRADGHCPRWKDPAEVPWPLDAASRKAARARITAPSSRAARTDASRSVCCRRTCVASISRTSTSDGPTAQYLLTPDNDVFAIIDTRLPAGSRLLDPRLRDAQLNRFRHSADRFNLMNEAPRSSRDVGGQALDVEKTHRADPPQAGYRILRLE